MKPYIASLFFLLLSFAPVPVVAQDGVQTCADFDAYEWAQSVFDDNPEGNDALDPDGDGIACPELLKGGAAPAIWTDRIPAGTAPATLLRIIDGDTIEIETRGGEARTVRLIGVDTPETKDPRRPVQCFGAEASAFTDLLLSLADEGMLWVERDVSDTDRFDRLLRYIWIEIGGEPYLLNEAIVRSGYGASSAYPPDVQYQDRLDAGERFAREYEVGLWSACSGPDEPLTVVPTPEPEESVPVSDSLPPPPQEAPVPAPQPPVTQPQVPASGCDASYPTLCLASFPDLDCGEIGARQFPVVPPDPHGFDRDGDGIGCESD